jgi:hypothetical protein
MSHLYIVYGRNKKTTSAEGGFFYIKGALDQQ